MSWLSRWFRSSGKRQLAEAVTGISAEGLILAVPSLRTLHSKLPPDWQRELTEAVADALKSVAERIGK